MRMPIGEMHIAELLDHGVAELDIVESFPHQIDGRRLVVADLDRRGAGAHAFARGR